MIGDKEINIDTGYYKCSQCGLSAGTIDQAAEIQNKIISLYGKKIGV